MIRVSSPGSPRTPSTKSGIDVKLYLLQDLPSSKLNLMTGKKKITVISSQKKILSMKRYYYQDRIHFRSIWGIVKVCLFYDYGFLITSEDREAVSQVIWDLDVLQQQ